MTQTYSKSRQQAEIAFSKAQSQFVARNRPVKELDTTAQAREENTLRLKKARLAKELEDRANVVAPLVTKRAIKA